MIRITADENFNGDALRGLLRRCPTLDALRVQDTEMVGVDDSTLLEWCVRERRVLLTTICEPCWGSFRRGSRTVNTWRAF